MPSSLIGASAINIAAKNEPPAVHSLTSAENTAQHLFSERRTTRSAHAGCSGFASCAHSQRVSKPATTSKFSYENATESNYGL